MNGYTNFISNIAHLVVLDAPQALDDGYPKEEEKTDAGATKNQHPGDVWLCWAVGVRVAWCNSLEDQKMKTCFMNIFSQHIHNLVHKHQLTITN